jgi:WS/DGAT/MGAT family acyltransferase
MTTTSDDCWMSGSDALLWTIERDPVLRSTVAVVAVLDRAPDMGVLADRLRAGLTDVPRLRQRVTPGTGPGSTPRWTTDREVDLSYHLRHVALPAGAPLGEVFDLAASFAMAGFDRARPLWELTVVEGLPDGRAAVIEKLHHSLTDGEGGVRIAMMLLDQTRDAVRPAPPAPPAPHPPDRIGLAGERARRGAAALGGAAGALGSAAAGLRSPQNAGRTAFETTRSVARMLAPVTSPLSPVMRGRSLMWRYDAFDVDLARLRDAAHAAGGTINDAYVTAVTGGLRRYHERHGAPVEHLRITMPVSLRTDDDPMGGNRFAPVRFAVPVGLADPAERLHEIRRLSHIEQTQPALPLTGLVAEALSRLPGAVATSLFGSMLKGIDVAVTNVAGLPAPVYLAGAEVHQTYAFAPPAGAAANVALLSHGDVACIGVVRDGTAVPDGDVFIPCLEAGFDEVLALAPRSRQAT